MTSLHSAQTPVAWPETNCTQETWANDGQSLSKFGISCDRFPKLMPDLQGSQQTNDRSIEAVLTSRPVLASNSRNVFCFRTEKALALGRLVTGQLDVFLVFVLANCLGQTLQEWLKSSFAHSINSVIWIARRGHCAVRVIESSHKHTKIRICIAECKSAPPWLVLKIPRQRLVASGTSADTGPEPWLMHPGHPSWTHKPGIART